jgi:hypothetical protein
MAACDFIGYFIFPVLGDLHVSILLSFLSLLCHPLPLSLGVLHSGGVEI